MNINTKQPVLDEREVGGKPKLTTLHIVGIAVLAGLILPAYNIAKVSNKFVTAGLIKAGFASWGGSPIWYRFVTGHTLSIVTHYPDRRQSLGAAAGLTLAAISLSLFKFKRFKSFTFGMPLGLFLALISAIPAKPQGFVVDIQKGTFTNAVFLPGTTILISNVASLDTESVQKNGLTTSTTLYYKLIANSKDGKNFDLLEISTEGNANAVKTATLNFVKSQGWSF